MTDNSSFICDVDGARGNFRLLSSHVTITVISTYPHVSAIQINSDTSSDFWDLISRAPDKDKLGITLVINNLEFKGCLKVKDHALLEGEIRLIHDSIRRGVIFSFILEGGSVVSSDNLKSSRELFIFCKILSSLYNHTNIF